MPFYKFEIRETIISTGFHTLEAESEDEAWDKVYELCERAEEGTEFIETEQGVPEYEPDLIKVQEVSS